MDVMNVPSSIVIRLFGYAAMFLAVNNVLRLEPFASWLLRLLRKQPSGLTSARRRELLHNAAFKITAHIHNCVAVPMATYVLFAEPELSADPFHAFSLAAQFLAIWSTGYFVHDILMVVTCYDLEGFGFLVHGFFCCSIFAYGLLRQQGLYFAAPFVMWEASSPFVHLRWFLYEMGLKESKLYVINGVVMILVFFLCRNALGLYSSIHFWKTSAAELSSSRPDAFPKEALYFFRMANVSLNFLNLFWLMKMVSGAVKVLRRQRNTSVNDKKES